MGRSKEIANVSGKALIFRGGGDILKMFEGVIPHGAFRVMPFRHYGHLTRIAERMRLMYRELCMGLFYFVPQWNP
jgi:hypothetical protein